MLISYLYCFLFIFTSVFLNTKHATFQLLFEFAVPSSILKSANHTIPFADPSFEFPPSIKAICKFSSFFELNIKVIFCHSFVPVIAVDSSSEFNILIFAPLFFVLLFISTLLVLIIHDILYGVFLFTLIV